MPFEFHGRLVILGQDGADGRIRRESRRNRHFANCGGLTPDLSVEVSVCCALNRQDIMPSNTGGFGDALLTQFLRFPPSFTQVQQFKHAQNRSKPARQYLPAFFSAASIVASDSTNDKGASRSGSAP